MIEYIGLGKTWIIGASKSFRTMPVNPSLNAVLLKKAASQSLAL